MSDFLKRSVVVAGLLLFSSIEISCATYQGKVGQSRNLMAMGQFHEAANLLEPLANEKNGDQVVYLLDYAVALQLSGKINESNKMLQEADRLVERQEYHSISREAGSLVLNQEMVQYKGDSFEKFFINAYGALNYLELGQPDEALVETRRMNDKYNKLNSEERKDFEKNVFGKYLSALIWEGTKNWDDAYIAYEEAYKLDPTISTLPADLVRSARRARREDSYRKWKKEFPQVKESKNWYDKEFGFLVILYEQGWGPRKYQPSGGSYNLAQLQPVFSQTQLLRATVSGEGTFQSVPIYDVSTAAIETLKHDYNWLSAKRIGAYATKEILADQVRQKDELLGAIAWVAMHASERADLRQWSTLPQTIQIVRVPLKVGLYDVKLEGLNGSASVTGELKEFQKIQIKSEKITFLRWRTLK
ncbi:MAG: hypothetical protein IPM97_04380 [Bdellovibrionaceae bacterium]|nr:hypothetical protein [Pseudobdellovibrionaceae bacterium]